VDKVIQQLSYVGRKQATILQLKVIDHCQLPYPANAVPLFGYN